MKLYFTLLLFLIQQALLGQYRPPGMRDMTFFKNLEDVFEEAMPWVEDVGTLNSSTNLVEQKKNVIQEALKWRPNGGYLIRVKSLRSRIGTAKVAMPPEFLGVGSLPSDIVALGASQPSISTDIDPNLIYDPDDTVYLWVTTQKGLWGKEKLVFGYILGPSANKVTNDALKKMADSDILANIEISQRGEVLEGVVQSLKKNVKDEERALRNMQHIATYRSNVEKLNKLEANLKLDLKKIGQANQTLSMLGTMRNLLSMASLGAQISASIEDSKVLKIENAKNPDELIQIVESYRTIIDGRITQGRNSITILQNNVTNERKVLVDELYKSGVPPNILKKF